MSVEVVLYGAPAAACATTPSACSSAARARSASTLRVVDITGDPELERRTAHEIPLVTVAGRRAFKYRVDPAELRRRVLAASQTGR